MELILAIVLGVLFGFVLQRIGAADPDKIIGMLALKDLHLMKAILSGIGISSGLLFVGLMLGVVDAGHLSIKGSYWGVLIGGLLLGFGWALSGYCPGTGVVAGGSGRKDAWIFIMGGLIGAGLFTVSFQFLKDSWIFSKIVGGKTTLVATSSAESLIDASWSPILAILIAVAMIVVAAILPMRVRQ